MTLLDGKKTSEKILDELKTSISKAAKKPRLEVILVGDDPASTKYVQMKQKAGERIGAVVNINHFDENIDTGEVISKIREFNESREVSGIMVQLPLPEEVDKIAVLEAINPSKDVDGLTSVNLDLLSKNEASAFGPATPLGIMALLDEYKIGVQGKKVVIVNGSNVVGIPLSYMMKTRGADVTVCDINTEDVPGKAVEADILVSGVGQGGFVTEAMVKEGAVVVDVGIDMKDGKVTGDVDFENVKGKCSYITPVPGGVGPMTVVSLLTNLIKAANYSAA